MGLGAKQETTPINKLMRHLSYMLLRVFALSVVYTCESIFRNVAQYISVSALVHIASLSRDNNGARDQARALGSISAKQADMLCVGDERNP